MFKGQKPLATDLLAINTEFYNYKLKKAGMLWRNPP